MDILQKALGELGIEKQFETSVKYSDHFRKYGSNIRMKGNFMLLKLSRAWKPISEDIRIGLAEELVVSLLKLKKTTMNMDLYNSFIKNLHVAAPKEKPEQDLLESFSRVNEKYFNNAMEIPNIVWGDVTIRKLGSYDYRTDTIILSSVLRGKEDFTDLVMHHELLHKKHKFSSRNGRSLHHSTAFKKEERSFENYYELEEQMKRYLGRVNLKRIFRFW